MRADDEEGWEVVETMLVVRASRKLSKMGLHSLSDPRGQVEQPQIPVFPSQCWQCFVPMMILAMRSMGPL